MKNINKLTLLLAVPFLFACEGTGGDDTGNVDDFAMFIEVNKTEIEADGKDAATFVIKDAKGNILSTETNLGYVSFKNVETEERLDRYETDFTSIDNGTFEFVGSYRGVETSNTVTVTAKNRSKYEKYHRNILFCKLTGTWCTYCPNMTAGLAGLPASVKDHLVILACHCQDSFSLPFGQADLGSYLQSLFGASGIPAGVYDLSVMDMAQKTADINAILKERRINNPSTCGIRISSVKMDGNDMKITASVKAAAGGSYDMACALVGGEYSYMGGTAVDNKYHDVVRSVSGNFLRYNTDSAKTLAADEEMTREFTISFETAPTAAELDNLHVVVFAHKLVDGESQVDNVAKCAYGETIDYILND